MHYDTSSCLKVYDCFFNSQLFSNNKLSVRKLKRNCGGGFLTRRSVLEKFPFLEDFYFEDVLIGERKMLESPDWNSLHSDRGTLISKQYENIQPTPLNDVKRLKTSQLEENLFQKFVFQLNIQEAEITEDSIFSYCSRCKKLAKLKTLKNVTCCEERVSIFLSLKLLVRDSSLKSQNSFAIYATIKEGRDDVFGLWQILPALQDLRKWALLNEVTLGKFNQKMKLFVNQVKNVKVVCELKKSALHKIFFLEICNTIFLP